MLGVAAFLNVLCERPSTLVSTERLDAHTVSLELALGLSAEMAPCSLLVGLLADLTLIYTRVDMYTDNTREYDLKKSAKKSPLRLQARQTRRQTVKFFVLYLKFSPRWDLCGVGSCVSCRPPYSY